MQRKLNFIHFFMLYFNIIVHNILIHLNNFGTKNNLFKYIELFKKKHLTAYNINVIIL